MLMMTSLPELQKQVWHSEDSVQISGSVMESSLTPAESLQGSGTANPLVCETWTVYQRHAKRLNHFHLSCLRKL